MLCGVIGGTIVAFLTARIAALPVIGPLLVRPRKDAPDASEWRLHATSPGGGACAPSLRCRRPAYRRAKAAWAH